MKKNLYIVTPATRLENLELIHKSIDWSYVTKWIVVYDKKIISKNPFLFRDFSSVKLAWGG